MKLSEVIRIYYISNEILYSEVLSALTGTKLNQICQFDKYKLEDMEKLRNLLTRLKILSESEINFILK